MPQESQDSHVRAREELLSESNFAETALLRMLSPLDAKHDASTITPNEESKRAALRAALAEIRGGVETLRLEEPATTQGPVTQSGSQSEPSIFTDDGVNVDRLVKLFSSGSALKPPK